MSKEQFIENWKKDIHAKMYHYMTVVGILSFAIEKYGKDKPIGEVLADVDNLFSDLALQADNYIPTLEDEFEQVKMDHIINDVIDSQKEEVSKKFEEAKLTLLKRIFEADEE